ncbi:hypothetical protein AB0O01_22775 [Streptomyces sp. NPDC093252]|uniref:hypothetical protein n=1 Tax=Streptomyces sp. NPDC093252 TaxID=3154980 RepID=UPI0034268FEE
MKRLRKANLAITVVAALAGAGMVVGKALVDQGQPLDLGPSIEVRNPSAGPTPSASRSAPPKSPHGPSSSPLIPTATPTGTAPTLLPAPESPTAAPTATASTRPPGGRPVPSLTPPRSSEDPSTAPPPADDDDDGAGGSDDDGGGD